MQCEGESAVSERGARRRVERRKKHSTIQEFTYRLFLNDYEKHCWSAPMSRGNGGMKRELLFVTLSLYLKGWGRKTVVRRGMSMPHVIHEAPLSRMTCRGRWNDHVLPMLVSVVSRVRSTPSLQLDKRTLQHQQRAGVRAEQERVASHLKRGQLRYIYPVTAALCGNPRTQGRWRCRMPHRRTWFS